jgi:hypothetical protein
LHGSQSLILSRFEPTICEALAELLPGMHELGSKPSGLALDFIHRNLMQPSELVDQSSANCQSSWRRAVAITSAKVSAVLGSGKSD